MNEDGRLGLSGRLVAELRKAPPGGAGTKQLRQVIRTPFGRLLFTRDGGEALKHGALFLQSHLRADHWSKGRLVERYDLGSGLTTQALAIMLVNQGVSAANANTLGLLKYMTSGTSSTAANAYDWQLNTQSGPVSTAITPTIGLSGDNATMQWQGTLNYTSTLGIQEFGLFAGGGTVGSQYNTSTNTFSATTATPGTSPSWTTNTWAGGYVVEVASATPVIGAITSNTATALTINPGWAQANGTGGSGATPSSNTSMTIYPLMADHKVFSVINVNSGDSITFTYTLTANSGG